MIHAAPNLRQCLIKIHPNLPSAPFAFAFPPNSRTEKEIV